jgi:hypothetical protein
VTKASLGYDHIFCRLWRAYTVQRKNSKKRRKRVLASFFLFHYILTRRMINDATEPMTTPLTHPAASRTGRYQISPAVSISIAAQAI